MSREEDELEGRDSSDELVGSVSRAGEDPRFGGSSVDLVSNGAFTEIEDDDQFDPVDVDETPWMPQIVDDDGSPGSRPYVEADISFEKASGLEVDDREAAGDDILGDEFSDRMRQIDEASVDGSGRQLDDLAVHAQVAEIRHSEDKQRAPYRNITPESAYQGMLGGKATFNPRTDVDVKEVVRWVGQDVEALPVTVAFSPFLAPVTPVGFFSPPPARPFVRVQWGTRDALHTVELDVGRGDQFTVAASNIYVSLGDTTKGNR